MLGGYVAEQMFKWMGGAYIYFLTLNSLTTSMVKFDHFKIFHIPPN